MSVPTNAGGDDRGGLAIDRLVSAAHRGLMPKLGAATATRAGLTIAGYGGDAAIGLDAATTALAGALTAADFAKLATLQVPVLRLNYDASTDLLNGAAIAAGTWTDVFANQSFTLASTASRFLVEVRIHVAVTAVALSSVALRANLNNGGATPKLAGAMVNAGGFGGVSGAPLQGSGFPAGANTIKVQIYCSTAATAYCRALTQPNIEFAAVRVLELTP